MSPLAHGRPHGQNLIFKFGAGFACQQVQLQGKLVGQAKCTVFPRYQKCGCFAAGPPEYLGEVNSFWCHTCKASKLKLKPSEYIPATKQGAEEVTQAPQQEAITRRVCQTSEYSDIPANAAWPDATEHKDSSV